MERGLVSALGQLRIEPNRARFREVVQIATLQPLCNEEGQKKPESKWVTRAEAAAYLGVSRWTVKRLVEMGKLSDKRNEKKESFINRQKLYDFSKTFIRSHCGRRPKNRMLPDGTLTGESEAKIYDLMQEGKNPIEIMHLLRLPLDKIQNFYRKTLLDWDPDYMTDRERELAQELAVEIEKRKTVQERNRATIEAENIRFQREALKQRVVASVK